MTGVARLVTVIRRRCDALTAVRGVERERQSRGWPNSPRAHARARRKRRARVVGILPNTAAVIRLTGAVPADTHDEWTTDERRYFSEESI